MALTPSSLVDKKLAPGASSWLADSPAGHRVALVVSYGFQLSTNTIPPLEMESDDEFAGIYWEEQRRNVKCAPLLPTSFILYSLAHLNDRALLSDCTALRQPHFRSTR